MDTSSEQHLSDRLGQFVSAWNRNDPHTMASLFANDGDLINPFGRWARGREEVEQLFEDEQTTFMKGTHYQVKDQEIRFINPDVAVVDWEAVITGIQSPEGAEEPPFEHHVTLVMRRENGLWCAVVARPEVYTPVPGQA